MMPITNNYQDS